jgi:hypothetical protein
MKHLRSFVDDTQHPDSPFDRSAERFQTQILLEIFRRPITDFLICVKIFVRWIRSPLIGSSPVGKWAITRASVLRVALPVEFGRIAT